jgi:hypothetical protein
MWPLEGSFLSRTRRPFRRPAGCEELLQPGLAFTGCHFVTSGSVWDVGFVELSILPAFGGRVDYLWGKTSFTDGVVATGGGRG